MSDLYGKPTTHFRQRVRERIGENMCPVLLWHAIQWAIEGNRNDLVAYVGRKDRKGSRFFQFRVPDGREFVVLINTKDNRPITVMPPDYLPESLRGAA